MMILFLQLPMSESRAMKDINQPVGFEAILVHLQPSDLRTAVIEHRTGSSTVLVRSQLFRRLVTFDIYDVDLYLSSVWY
jgi:hypothetical protein